MRVHRGALFLAVFGVAVASFMFGVQLTLLLSESHIEFPRKLTAALILLSTFLVVVGSGWQLQYQDELKAASADKVSDDKGGAR